MAISEFLCPWPQRVIIDFFYISSTYNVPHYDRQHQGLQIPLLVIILCSFDPAFCSIKVRVLIFQYWKPLCRILIEEGKAVSTPQRAARADDVTSVTHRFWHDSRDFFGRCSYCHHCRCTIATNKQRNTAPRALSSLKLLYTSSWPLPATTPLTSWLQVSRDRGNASSSTSMQHCLLLFEQWQWSNSGASDSTAAFCF